MTAREFQEYRLNGWETMSRGGYIQDEKKRKEVTSVAGKELEVSGNSVASLGGIVAYSPGMRKVQFGDGSEVTTGVLLSSNPGVNSIALLSSLEDLPSRFYTPQQLAARIQAAAASMSESETFRAIQRWQDAMKRMSQAPTVAATSASTVTTTFRANQPLLSTDDAMALIVETVRNAGSPEEMRKLAGQWLTRFTKEMSDILRELDRENE